MASGIEGPQLDTVTALAKLGPKGPRPAVAKPVYVPGEDYSPNQRLNALVIAVWIGIPGSIPALLAFLQQMARVGHQAYGAGYGDEQGCPNPHSGLWCLGMAGTLWLSIVRPDCLALRALAIAYWGQHMALIEAFWTPAGPRMPCSRAAATLDTATNKVSPRPAWTLDAHCYLLVTGHPVPDLKTAVGNISPPDETPYKLLESCSAAFSAIRAAMHGGVKLACPIRKWPRPGGGFFAAFETEVQMNERLSWVEVDEAGNIMGGTNSLADFVVPEGVPQIIGGPQLAPSPVPQPDPKPAPVSPKPPTVSTPAPIVSPAKPGIFARFLAWLRSL